MNTTPTTVTKSHYLGGSATPQTICGNCDHCNTIGQALQPANPGDIMQVIKTSGKQ